MNQSVVSLLLVVCVAGVAAQSVATETAPRAISVFDNAVDKKHKAPASCGDNKDKHDCLHIGAQESDCAWCEGDYMPASCLSAIAAKFIPEMVAKCKLPEEKEEIQSVEAAADDNKKHKAPTSCGDNKDKHDCLHIGAQEGDCAWCEGDYMPASCLSAMAAKYIPEMVAKCKLPKKNEEADVAGGTMLEAPEKAPGSSSSSGSDDWPSGGGDWPSGGGSGAGGGCKDKESKKKCLRDDSCAWCKKSPMGEGCTDAMSVKYLPKFIAECKLADKDDVEAVEMS